MEQAHSGLDRILDVRNEVPPEMVDFEEPTVKLVIFELCGEWFAFRGEAIREILPPVTVYFVPGCPSSLEGVINVRGNIESVIQLAEMLGKPVPDPVSMSSILRGQGGGMNSGIRVDRVVDVVDVVQSAIQPIPATMPEQLRRVVSGLLRHQDTPVAILDLNRIFEDYRIGLG